MFTAAGTALTGCPLSPYKEKESLRGIPLKQMCDSQFRFEQIVGVHHAAIHQSSLIFIIYSAGFACSGSVCMRFETTWILPVRLIPSSLFDSGSFNL